MMMIMTLTDNRELRFDWRDLSRIWIFLAGLTALWANNAAFLFFCTTNALCFVICECRYFFLFQFFTKIFIKIQSKVIIFNLHLTKNLSVLIKNQIFQVLKEIHFFNLESNFCLFHTAFTIWRDQFSIEYTFLLITRKLK